MPRVAPKLAFACALAAAAPLLVLASGRAARAQQASTRSTADLELAPQNDLDRLQQAKTLALAGDERAISEIEALLARVAHDGPIGDARNAPGDALVPPASEDSPRLTTLRAAVLDAMESLPDKLKTKLADAQAEAVATERGRGADDDERLLRRYPLMAGAVELARKLAERAFESGDDLGSASFDRLALRLARLKGGTPVLPRAALVRRALACAEDGDLEGLDDALARIPPAPGGGGQTDSALLLALRERLTRQRDGSKDPRTPPAKPSVVLSASYPFARKEPPPGWKGAQSPIAAHVEDRVFASDGSRLLTVNARTGELKGRLPQDDEDTVPLLSTIPGNVCIQGDLVLAPLYFESFLVPARESSLERSHERTGPEDGDASVRGGFLSLSAFDATTLRLLWWDGDAGTQPRAAEDAPSGRPAGTETTSEERWRRLARAHVVGRPLMDGRRVYVPLATSGAEPQVWIAAYERATGDRQPLALVPAWCTYVTASVQARNPGQPGTVAPMPTVNPKLALDPEGRVIVQTELGIVAALEARTGAIEWVVRLEEPANAAPGFGRRPRAPTRRYAVSNDPPVVVPARGRKPSVAVFAPREEGRFIALDCEDGSVEWVAPWNGFLGDGTEAPRVRAVAPDVVVGYGGPSLSFFDGRSGKPFATVPLGPREFPVGPLARAGNGTLVLPYAISGESPQDPEPPTHARVVTFEIKRGDRGALLDVTASFREPDSAFPLPEVKGSTSLLCLDGRLVAVTPRKVFVFEWQKPRAD